MKEALNEINETLGYTYFDPTEIEEAGKKFANLIPYVEALVLKAC